ncbi:hypothetical protein P3L10_033242 [Capsicum annuum]
MTCNNCGEPNHNAKSCYKEKSGENTSRKEKRPMTENNSQSSIIEEEHDLEQIQIATQDFEPFGPDVRNEEDPPLTSMVYPEFESWIEKLMTRGVSTGTRKINFTISQWCFSDVVINISKDAFVEEKR